MAARRNFSDEQIEEMVRLAVDEDRSLYYIARRFETSAQAVRYHLLKRGATLSQRDNLPSSTHFVCDDGCEVRLPAAAPPPTRRCALHNKAWRIADGVQQASADRHA